MYPSLMGYREPKAACSVCRISTPRELMRVARCCPSSSNQEPFYPFLSSEVFESQQHSNLKEDSSAYLCVFCNALLEAQWNIYEAKGDVFPALRKYSVKEFICSVCGVETYRRRVTAIPFQNFLFLKTARKVGSVTVGGEFAVVCIDCSETLWEQSEAYVRCGLPMNKRQFNWMKRSSPPEGSVDAAFARLPCGETRIPRYIFPFVDSLKSLQRVEGKTIPEPPKLIQSQKFKRLQMNSNSLPLTSKPMIPLSSTGHVRKHKARDPVYNTTSVANFTRAGKSATIVKVSPPQYLVPGQGIPIPRRPPVITVAPLVNRGNPTLGQMPAPRPNMDFSPKYSSRTHPEFLSDSLGMTGRPFNCCSSLPHTENTLNLIGKDKSLEHSKHPLYPNMHVQNSAVPNPLFGTASEISPIDCNACSSEILSHQSFSQLLWLQLANRLHEYNPQYQFQAFG